MWERRGFEKRMRALRRAGVVAGSCLSLRAPGGSAARAPERRGAGRWGSSSAGRRNVGTGDQPCSPLSSARTIKPPQGPAEVAAGHPGQQTRARSSLSPFVAGHKPAPQARLKMQPPLGAEAAPSSCEHES